jgi:protein-tyrosine phosphatase
MIKGLVDLHVHLLPGIDDGAKTMEDTLAMVRALVALGFTEAAPSPHHRAEYASGSRALCEEKLTEVRAALAAAGLSFPLHSNAESYFMDEQLLPSVQSGEARLLAGSKHLLVEAPYSGPFPRLMDVIFRMKLKGVTPLVAHPERCMEFEKKGRAAEVVQAGALLQLDVGSLIGKYGKPAQQLARQFLDADLYAVAATDLHSPQNALGWVGDSLKALEKAGGKDAVARLFVEGPLLLVPSLQPAR